VFVMCNEWIVKRMGSSCSIAVRRARLSPRATFIIFPRQTASSSNLGLYATTRLTVVTTNTDIPVLLLNILHARLNPTVHCNGASPGETGVRGGGDGNGKAPTSCRRNRCLRAIRAMASEQTRALERLADGWTGRMRRALTSTTYVSV